MYLRRWLPGLTAAGAFGAFAVLWRFQPETYFRSLEWLGVPAFRFPFLDAHTVLSWIECHRMGMDVYSVNPCDVNGATMDYSPVLLKLSWTGATVGLAPFVGSGLALAFLLGMTSAGSGRNWQITLALTAASVSPPAVFAVERGNLDLLVFFVAVAAASACTKPFWRNFGYGLAAVCAAVKYYPILLLLLCAFERPLRAILTAVTVAVGFLVLVLVIGPEQWHRAGHNLMIASNPFDNFAIGARSLPYGLALVLGAPVYIAPIALACLLLVAADSSRRFVPLLYHKVSGLPERDARLLLAGSILMTGCFFTAQNADYRAIYLLSVLPGMLSMAETESVPGRFIFCTCGAILVVLWRLPLMALVPTPIARFGLWAVMQILWWWVAVALLAVILAMVMLRLKAWPIRRLLAH